MADSNGGGRVAWIGHEGVVVLVVTVVGLLLAEAGQAGFNLALGLPPGLHASGITEWMLSGAMLVGFSLLMLSDNRAARFRVVPQARFRKVWLWVFISGGVAYLVGMVWAFGLVVAWVIAGLGAAPLIIGLGWTWGERRGLPRLLMWSVLAMVAFGTAGLSGWVAARGQIRHAIVRGEREYVVTRWLGDRCVIMPFYRRKKEFGPEFRIVEVSEVPGPCVTEYCGVIMLRPSGLREVEGALEEAERLMNGERR